MLGEGRVARREEGGEKCAASRHRMESGWRSESAKRSSLTAS